MGPGEPRWAVADDGPFAIHDGSALTSFTPTTSSQGAADRWQAPLAQVRGKATRPTTEIVVPPRTGQVPSERIEYSSGKFDLEIRFPDAVQAKDVTWTLEGDVLEVVHDGLRPPYYKGFLVPSGWDLVASTAESSLLIRLTPPFLTELR